MATKLTEIKRYIFKTPHHGQSFNMDIDGDDVDLFWVRDTEDTGRRVKCILADVPRSEVILLLKEMIEKLEGGE